jgi:hypothetical protein
MTFAELPTMFTFLSYLGNVHELNNPKRHISDLRHVACTGSTFGAAAGQTSGD